VHVPTASSMRTQPDLVNVLNLQGADGVQVALSHAYKNVAVIFADIVGMKGREREEKGNGWRGRR
jgi:hypothetical protein